MFVFYNRVTVVLPKTEKITDPRVILIRSGMYSPGQYTIGEVLSIANVIQKVFVFYLLVITKLKIFIVPRSVYFYNLLCTMLKISHAIS